MNRGPADTPGRRCRQTENRKDGQAATAYCYLCEIAVFLLQHLMVAKSRREYLPMEGCPISGVDKGPSSDRNGARSGRGGGRHQPHWFWAITYREPTSAPPFLQRRNTALFADLQHAIATTAGKLATLPSPKTSASLRRRRSDGLLRRNGDRTRLSGPVPKKWSAHGRLPA